jgi:DNA-binding NarL/FixJ family response regulator/transposase
MADNLTYIEQQIVPLLTRGLPNHSISESLRISERAVEGHIYSLLRKLRLGSRAQLSSWLLSSQQAPPAAAIDCPELLDPLTAREREVTTLIARGMTNREIAAELVIAEATVAVHVKRVLSKTGFASRSAIAAWAISQGGVPGLVPSTGTAVIQPSTTWLDGVETRSNRSRGIVASIPNLARELSDDEWTLIEPLLPPQPSTGRRRADDRQTLNGILWVLGSAARWEDVPRRYGAASTCHSRFRQWQEHGVWRRVCQVLESTRAEDDSPVTASPESPPKTNAAPSRMSVPAMQGRARYFVAAGALLSLALGSAFLAELLAGVF